MRQCHAWLRDLANATVTDSFAPPENIVFLANELGRGKGNDQRASRRLLYGTMVAFRCAGRDEDDEPGDRTGDADVEQGLAGGERLADFDDRAERARYGEQREREEEGQRRVDVVNPARDVVPHLVGAEDAEHGRAIDERVAEEDPVGDDRLSP